MRKQALNLAPEEMAAGSVFQQPSGLRRESGSNPTGALVMWVDGFLWLRSAEFGLQIVL